MNTIQNNPLLMGLAGAVLNPGLRTILVYDAPYYGLQQIASYLSAVMRSLGHKMVTTQLGSTEHDDHLWGSIPLPSGDTVSHQTVQFKHLLFSRQQNKAHIELILIPNLAEISLSIARAGIMQMGANVVHLERNGQSEVWQPQQYWVASCSKNDIGSVSSHLVDRFALRLKWQESPFSIDHRLRMRHLQQQLTSNENSLALSDADYTQIKVLADLIKAAQKHRPHTTLETITSALDYFSEELSPEQLYHRHEITLARYAVSLAQLSGANNVDKQHVADAATLMGLNKKEAEGDNTNIPDTTPNKEEQKISTQTPENMDKGKSNSIDQTTEKKPAQQNPKEQVTAEIQKETVTPLTQSILAPENPYLEDSEPMQHEEDSLRLPLRRYTLGRADHGTIIGVERGSSFQDIAIVSTILHAALFSKLRQSTLKQAKHTTRIYITQEDLHHYRRSPAPEHMLLLLLDYTSLKHCDWQEALLPYLSQAYIRRASISIIKVGAQDSQHELQAEVVSARNMLVPSIAQALEATNGKTTPLAHGMQLAQQTLQRSLQHGRNTVQYVTLVVISDGRGNVPLQASIDKRVTSLVTKEGVGDALKIAQEIREMKHVESILLNPQPLHYTQLPITLADVLGATIKPIPSSTIETGVTQ